MRTISSILRPRCGSSFQGVIACTNLQAKGFINIAVNEQKRDGVVMNKLIQAVVVSAPMFLLSGCGMDVVTYDTVAYDPGYTNDYVYSVGYYYNRPYWGNNYYYYSGCGVRSVGYWGSCYNYQY